jgi:hypothetical protein
MPCRRSLPPAYRPRPCQDLAMPADTTRRCASLPSLRFIANVSLQRRSDFATRRARRRGRRRCERCSRDPAQLRVRFRKPEAAMGTIMLPQPASQPRPHAWMRSNPTYTRRGNIATTAAASQGDSSTASATGRGSHVRSVETAATTVDTGDWSVRGRRRRRTNTMPNPTSARMAAAPARRSRLQKERFWRAPSTFALGCASRLGSTPVNDGC